MSTEQKDDPMKKMEYRLLGGTGLKVSVLGLGVMSFTSEDQAVELISTVRKHGVNFFDNAEFYGNPCGTGEILFGAALKKLQSKDPKLYRRSDLVITTKIFYGVSDGQQPNGLTRTFGPNEVGLSRKHLMEGINSALKRLQMDYVDVIYAHSLDDLTPTEEIVRGFTDIIKSGKALYWGTSKWPATKIVEAYWIAKLHHLIPPVVEQPRYNMFSRNEIEKDYLPLFQYPYKIGTTTFSALDSGILTGKYVKEIPEDSRLGGKGWLGKWWGADKYITQSKNEKVAKLMDIAKELNVSMVSLALAWTIKNKNVSCCILGGSKGHQLEQNMDAIETAKKLNKEILTKIEAILQNKPKQPPLFGQMARFAEYKTNPI